MSLPEPPRLSYFCGHETSKKAQIKSTFEEEASRSPDRETILRDAEGIPGHLGQGYSRHLENAY